MNQDEKILFLTKWAADNGAVLALKGEVGFGRPCVGIMVGNHYPDYDYGVPATCPPLEVNNAYHKHDCLCILGQGEDAINELYLWVKSLNDNDVVIEVESRPPTNMIDAIIHGASWAYLTIKYDE